MTDFSIVLMHDIPTSVREVSSDVQCKATNFIKARISHFFPGITIHDDKEIDSLLYLKGPSPLLALSSAQPFFDATLALALINHVTEHGGKASPQGAVPGTAPLFAASSIELAGAHSPTSSFVWHTQRKYNSQLNLCHPKRAKVFLSLVSKAPHLQYADIDTIMAFLSSQQGIELVLSYGEDVVLERYAHCPSCKSSKIVELHSDVGQPVLGFLPKNAAVYNLCQLCQLVFLNPQMHEEDLWRYYDKYAYGEKWDAEQLSFLYENMGPSTTSHYENYQRIEPTIEGLAENATIMDLGGGRGEFSVFARRLCPGAQITMRDFRINADLSLVLAAYDIETIPGNFLHENLGEQQYDLITAWEVIEHIKIETLYQFLCNIAKALKPGGKFCFSTPDFFDPLARSIDFWSMAPGEHISVLSRAFLEPLLQRAGLRILEEYHESVCLKSSERWYGYGAANAATFTTRADYRIMATLLENDSLREQIRACLRDKNLGSELILCTERTR